MCPKIVCFIYLQRLWINLSSMFKLPNFCKLFFYQLSTFLKTNNDCRSLFLPDCRSGVLGQKMHLFIGLMVNYVTLLSTTALVTIYS